MKTLKEANEALINGDPLTDDELQMCMDRLENLGAELMELGKEFKLAYVEIFRRRNVVASYLFARMHDD